MSHAKKTTTPKKNTRNTRGMDLFWHAMQTKTVHSFDDLSNNLLKSNPPRAALGSGTEQLTYNQVVYALHHTGPLTPEELSAVRKFLKEQGLKIKVTAKKSCIEILKSTFSARRSASRKKAKTEESDTSDSDRADKGESKPAPTNCDAEESVVSTDIRIKKLMAKYPVEMQKIFLDMATSASYEELYELTCKYDECCEKYQMMKDKGRRAVVTELIHMTNVSSFEELATLMSVKVADIERLFKGQKAQMKALMKEMKLHAIKRKGGPTVKKATLQLEEKPMEEIPNEEIHNPDETQKEEVLEEEIPNSDEAQKEEVLEEEKASPDEAQKEEVLEEEKASPDETQKEEVLEEEIPNSDEAQKEEVLEEEIPNSDEAQKEEVLEEETPNPEETKVKEYNSLEKLKNKCGAIQNTSVRIGNFGTDPKRYTKVSEETPNWVKKFIQKDGIAIWSSNIKDAPNPDTILFDTNILIDRKVREHIEYSFREGYVSMISVWELRQLLKSKKDKAQEALASMMLSVNEGRFYRPVGDVKADINGDCDAKLVRLAKKEQKTFVTMDMGAAVIAWAIGCPCRYYRTDLNTKLKLISNSSANEVAVVDAGTKEFNLVKLLRSKFSHVIVTDLCAQQLNNDKLTSNGSVNIWVTDFQQDICTDTSGYYEPHQMAVNSSKCLQYEMELIELCRAKNAVLVSSSAATLALAMQHGIKTYYHA